MSLYCGRKASGRAVFRRWTHHSRPGLQLG